MKSFDQSDVSPKPHPKALTDAVLEAALAWPSLEIAMTQWIGHALKVRPSETGILLGAMDTRTKIDKLKAIYVHRSDKEAVALLKAITKEHKDAVKIRNIVAHAMLLGASKASLGEAYFLTSRAIPDQHGFMEVARVPFDDIKKAGQFARSRARDIRDLLKARGEELD